MTRDSSEPVVLDCTLRDGGFYTDWDYPDDLVRAYLDAMERAGVAYAEVGYRALEYPKYVGALGYCPDWYLMSIVENLRLRLGVMVDAKEFMGREEQLRRLFTRRTESPVALVRVAATAANLSTALELVTRLHDLGYVTTINLMAIATLSERECAEAFASSTRSVADVLYFADSFGSMYPEDIRRCARLLKNNSDKVWGVHLHNNLELAFCNALEAMDAGASWIDTSVTGMGRGPGNLKTELFMQHLRVKMGREIDTAPLYEFIGRHMMSLLDKHRWGPGPAYVLSGFLGAHPSFAQQLLATGRYSVSEVTRVLAAVHATGKATRFDPRVLDEAISSRHHAPRVSTQETVTRKRLSPASAPWTKRPVLIVGRGPSVLEHAGAINKYIQSAQPIVLECNHQSQIAAAEHHFCAFVVSANAQAQSASASRAGKRIILASGALVEGNSSLPDFVETYDVRSGRLEVADDSSKMILPFDVVSMLAIACAVRCGAQQIDLVGFDGYASSRDERDLRMQQEMHEFLALLRTQMPDLALTSLTRTSFDIQESSVYARIAS